MLWRASEEACCRIEISHRKLSLKLNGVFYCFDGDLVPARGFLRGTICFDASGEHGGGNTFGKNDWLTEASFWIERDFVFSASRPPAQQNTAISEFQAVLHRLKHGGKDLLTVADFDKKYAKLEEYFDKAVDLKEDITDTLAYREDKLFKEMDQEAQRVKGSEKFWTSHGAEAILQIRAAYLSDDDRAAAHHDRRPRGRAVGANRLRWAA